MISNCIYSSRSNEWGTPQKLFDQLDAEFHFTLDPCSTHENAKCVKHYTIEDDGLSQSWDGERVFCNPPYGKDIPKWVKKAASSNATVVMLIPARTDVSWFHDYIYGKAEIRFLRGRLQFVKEDGTSNRDSPFPSMVVIFNEQRNNNSKSDPSSPV